MTVGITVLAKTKGTGLNQYDRFGTGYLRSLMVWAAGSHQEPKPDVVSLGIGLFSGCKLVLEFSRTCETSLVSDQDSVPAPPASVSIRRDLCGLWTAGSPRMLFTWFSYSKDVCR